MTQIFCTSCGTEFAGPEKFCTSCGEARGGSSPTATDNDDFGPTSLPMPDGLPSIRLGHYQGSDRAEAIALINRLSTAQREVWVKAGQPDILLWPGADFSTWLGALAPDFYNAAKSSEPIMINAAQQPFVYLARPSNAGATAGFVLSLISLVTFYLLVIGVLGLILGIVGANKARALEYGGHGPVGRGLATAAIIISSVSLVLSLSFFASL